MLRTWPPNLQNSPVIFLLISFFLFPGIFGDRARAHADTASPFRKIASARAPVLPLMLNFNPFLLISSAGCNFTLFYAAIVGMGLDLSIIICILQLLSCSFHVAEPNSRRFWAFSLRAVFRSWFSLYIFCSCFRECYLCTP